MFLFFMFYFVFFNLLRCVLFSTEPHACVNLAYILLKKKQCCSVEITNKMQPCNRIYYSTVH